MESSEWLPPWEEMESNTAVAMDEEDEEPPFAVPEDSSGNSPAELPCPVALPSEAPEEQQPLLPPPPPPQLDDVATM
jgi:hypothetical protein